MRSLVRIDLYQSRSAFIHNETPIYSKEIDPVSVASKSAEDMIASLEMSFKKLHQIPSVYVHRIIEER